MSDADQAYRKRVKGAGFAFGLAMRASRNRSLLDRTARWLLGRMLKPLDGREPVVIEQPGYDPAELDRYERGELGDAPLRPFSVVRERWA